MIIWSDLLEEQNNDHKKVVSLFLNYSLTEKRASTTYHMFFYFIVFQSMCAPDVRRIPSLSSRDWLLRRNSTTRQYTLPPTTLLCQKTNVCVWIEFSKVRVKKYNLSCTSHWVYMIKCYKIVELFVFCSFSDDLGKLCPSWLQWLSHRHQLIQPWDY